MAPAPSAILGAGIVNDRKAGSQPGLFDRNIISMISASRKLRVYLCNTPNDMYLVHELYRLVYAQPWIDLIWNGAEIFQASYWERQTRLDAHAMVVFLSKEAIADQDGFGKNLNSVLETSEKKIGEPVLIIVIKLDDCDVPEQITPYPCLNYFGSEDDRAQVQEDLLELLMVRERQLMKDQLSPLFGQLVPASRQLRVLICCASQDKVMAGQIYESLFSQGWIFPWLIRENAYQLNSNYRKIEAATRETDVVLVLLSEEMVSKKGFEEKEFYTPLANTQRKEDGSVLIIPIRLNDCMPPPRFQSWHWLDYFVNGAQDKLLDGLRYFAEKLKIRLPAKAVQGVSPILFQSGSGSSEAREDPELCYFIKIPSNALKAPGYTFWISQYPVTSAQYEKFLRSEHYSDQSFWTNYRKYDESCRYIGEWGDQGYKWMKQRREHFASYPPEMSRVQPHNWQDPDLTLVALNKPIIGITWYEASAYCNWLTKYWKEIPDFVSYSNLEPSLDLYFRLPLETEWLWAADFCQTKPPGSYPSG
ncbi:MAG TPA: SUMF1/EgtB/PvdO family nonheme iron enzyme, partial [Anaerolineales bacterium]|nr:SUMF1/EgtB/PvdO family nonheme iron enzyme [Anaerolineales bacterium]